MTNASTLAIAGLRKSYSGVPAVRGIDFEVQPREFLTLLGPSGCGKTTLLRCIAGLEQITEGRIALGDTVFADTVTGEATRTERRNVGMVFQNYALWPHMTVEENVMYPLQMRRTSRRDARRRAHEVLELVELAHLARRPVGNLSGGQQQRVALARAVVAQPPLMLFDEPLSNLDASLRETMRAYIRSVHQAADCMSIYVTHDQSEALSLSDRIAVMFDGRVRQIDTPEVVYRRPVDVRVARFLGFDNFLTGELVGITGDSAEVRISDSGTILGATTTPLSPGATVSVAIRSNHVALVAEDGSELKRNEWSGIVAEVRDAQSVVDYRIEGGGIALTSRVLDVAREHAPVKPRLGDRVRVRIEPDQAVVLRENQEDAADSE